MSDCNSYARKLIPLRKVVSAAAVDMREDLGRVEQVYSHWAARGLRKLTNETLRIEPKFALLPVNKNFHTATLPPDFDTELFVGYINGSGKKIQITTNSKLAVTSQYIDTLGADDRCPRCSQPKSICEDLQLTEEIKTVTIDGVDYDQTIIKKLYPNGDYMIETTTPAKNMETGSIENVTTKEFITNFDLSDCGCLEVSEDNLCKLQSSCPDIYACYYANCYDKEPSGYRIYEQNNLIQLDQSFKSKYVYLEYLGYMPKINGQYCVPSVAFETLVEWTKFKSIENKRGVSGPEKSWVFDHYRRERSNMEQVLGKIDISLIVNAALLTPKFEFKSGNDWYTCYQKNEEAVKATSSLCAEDSATSQSSGGSTVIRTTENVIVFRKQQFTVGEVNALMTEGQTQLIINEASIKTESVHVVLNTQTLNESVDDEISYTVVYNANNVVITFNQGVINSQKYIISYAKAV